MESGEIIYGIHPVDEALKSSRKISKILIKKNREYNKQISDIILFAQAKNIKVKYVTEEEIREYTDSSHQGLLAFIEESREASDLDYSKNLYLMVDHITDVHNLGAILRSADFFNVDGVILPRHRNARINDVVEKTSAGAVNYLKIIWVANLANEIKQFQKHDFWVIGADTRGQENIYNFKFPEKSVIIVGSEDKGISPLVRQNTDFLVSIPQSGHVESLNVSVAAALFLYQYRSLYWR